MTKGEIVNVMVIIYIALMAGIMSYGFIDYAQKSALYGAPISQQQAVIPNKVKL